MEYMSYISVFTRECNCINVYIRSKRRKIIHVSKFCTVRISCLPLKGNVQTSSPSPLPLRPYSWMTLLCRLISTSPRRPWCPDTPTQKRF